MQARRREISDVMNFIKLKFPGYGFSASVSNFQDFFPLKLLSSHSNRVNTN